MKDGKQDWLFPAIGKQIEDDKYHGIGEKPSEGEIYAVPKIVMTEEARKELATWPLEISSRKIVNNKPFALFAELEPKILLDFHEIKDIDEVKFKMKDTNHAEITLSFKDGRILQEELILHEDGKVQLIW